MKKYEFEGMPLDELWSLHQQICRELEKRITEEKRKLQHRLNELNRKFGSEKVDNPQRRPYPKVPPKFRNPDDPSITWSGRGKHPRWIDELLAAGRAIDDFRIAESTS